MKIKLIDISEKLCFSWKNEFDGCADIEVINDSIFNHPCDAICSPSNSFGFFNGGIDYYISEFFKDTFDVQDRVQQKIKDEYDGELLVGQSLVVPTDNEKFPYLISAPTMRVPLGLASGTRISPNVYLAAKAIFLALKKNPHIKSVAIPGLGTGVGAVPPKECAIKMRMAYEDFYLGQYKFPSTLGQANLKHWEETTIKPSVLNG